MTRHNFSAGQDSKWVRPAVAAGIGIPAGYAAYQYGGNLGTYLGDRTNVEHTAKLLVPVQRSSISLNPYQTTHQVSYQEFPAVSSTKPVIDFTKPMGGFQRLDNPMMGEDEITETKIGNIDPDTFRRMEHLAGNALGIDTDLSQANVPITDLPQQELIDKATRLLVQPPIKFIVNHSRRPSRFVALHTNFAKRKSDVANPGGVVINLPNGKKYTEDDIRYLNNKRVFGTDSWALIPSAMINVPLTEGLSSVVAGNPMGHKEKGFRAIANITAGFGLPYLYSPGANIVDYNAYLDENTRRKSIGRDIPLPDKDDLDYMNAKLRYENSAVGRHPVLTGLTGLTSPIAMDAWRGVQNRGRAWKYAIGSPLAGGALGAAAGAALGSVLGDPESGAFFGGLAGSGLVGLTGGVLYNTRGKKHYEAEKAKRKAEGRMY